MINTVHTLLTMSRWVVSSLSLCGKELCNISLSAKTPGKMRGFHFIDLKIQAIGLTQI